MQEQISVRLDFFKECKHSHRFQESTVGPEPAKIGSIYIPKASLKELGWNYGDSVKVTISK